MKDQYIFARQVADGCFDEVKNSEDKKQLLSYFLLIALLSTTFLANMALYVATFAAFFLQIWYVLVVRQSKLLNAKAQEAHKLRLYFSLFKSHSIYTELADLHTSLKTATIESLKGKKYESYDDTTPHEINKVRKLYWILQENCFYNRTLYKLERNEKTWRLTGLLLILALVLAFHPYFSILPNLKSTLISSDISNIYFIPRLAFITFSSFIVIELIDNCYDFHNGSIEMERLYTKIKKLSKKPKMDELLTIISNYYAILRQTPNLSDEIYKRNGSHLEEGWKRIYTSKSITKHKEDIIDTLKILSGLLCDTSNWCIIGSTSCFLQGGHVNPNDIDIITDEKGIESIKKYCSAFIYEKPIYREAESIRSIYGYLMINNIVIDVMTDLMGKIDGKWENFDYESIRKVKVKYDCWTFNLRHIEDEIDIQNKLDSSK